MSHCLSTFHPSYLWGWVSSGIAEKHSVLEFLYNLVRWFSCETWGICSSNVNYFKQYQSKDADSTFAHDFFDNSFHNYITAFKHRRQRGRVVLGAGAVIRRSRVQGLRPVTGGICFSVVPSSNPRSRFVNSKLVCLLPVGILNYVTFI